MPGVQISPRGQISHGPLSETVWSWVQRVHPTSTRRGGGGGGERVSEGITAWYRVSFPAILSQLRCAVEGCQCSASSWTNLWVHFSHRHPWDRIVIVEEGNQPHSHFPLCDMFFPQEELNQAHPTSDMCQRRSERNQQRLVVA